MMRRSPRGRRLASEAFRGFVLAIGIFAAGCASDPKLTPEMLAAEPRTTLLHGEHAGPPVAAGQSGTGRYARVLHEAFDEPRAFATVQWIDRFYRAPANDGYEAVLAHLEAALREAGYGSKAGFEIEVLESELEAPRWPDQTRAPAQAWTPLSASVTVHSGGDARELHAFDTTEDRDRTMLPVNAPSASARGRVATTLDELDAGEVLVTSAKPTVNVLSRAHSMGAAAVLSSYIEAYNVDPTGERRHVDAIPYRTVPAGTPLPVAMISERSLAAIQEALARDPDAEVALTCETRLDARKLKTLCARIVGGDRPTEAVAVASHVQEPGACDNASGVAGLLESACGLVELIESGKVARPSRTLVFLWGDEFRQSAVWLASTQLVPIAGLSSDMTGESRERTGAIALLERMPDPGAVVPLPPDEHTPWGQTEVAPESLRPNGLAVIARCAIGDVAAIDRSWKTAEHPYEGGSDHDEFIKAGIPAALFWHFTDFAYHTSLDRLEMVDPAEMRRTGAALIATALALADPRPEDLDRYLRSLNEEHLMRVDAAARAQDPETADRWHSWCRDARQWLRVECLRIPPEQR